MRCTGPLVIALVACTALPAAADTTVRIGSKKFTESVLLGEMARRLAEDAGVEAHHQPELGGTRVLWSALQAGELDVYAEYTGTVAVELLGADHEIAVHGREMMTSIRASLASA